MPFIGVFFSRHYKNDNYQYFKIFRLNNYLAKKLSRMSNGHLTKGENVSLTVDTNYICFFFWK